MSTKKWFENKMIGYLNDFGVDSNISPKIVDSITKKLTDEDFKSMHKDIRQIALDISNKVDNKWKVNKNER